MTEVVLACGFLPDVLREALPARRSAPGYRFATWSSQRAAPPARSALPPRSWARVDQRFLALNGDVLTDLDLTALLGIHAERGAQATLGLHPVEDSSAYGLVRCGEAGEVLEFLEKTGERYPVRSTPACTCWSVRCSI